MSKVEVNEVPQKNDLDLATSHLIVGRLILRGLGVVHLAAFISLWTQVMGLIGSDGIAPANYFMDRVTRAIETNDDLSRWDVPTLFHLVDVSDLTIHWTCFSGVIFAILLIIGYVPRICLAMLGILYLSIYTVASPFLSYQWDILLLETSAIGIILAPTCRHLNALRDWPSNRIGIWLFRILLFKLILSSGLVKLNSGDPTWQDLSALDFHYWTQPIPNPWSWHIHHFGGFSRIAGTFSNHFVELVVPWLIIFGLPKRLVWAWLPTVLIGLYAYKGDYNAMDSLAVGGFTCLLWLAGYVLRKAQADFTYDDDMGRKLAGITIILLMFFVGMSGNYGFFNALTIVIAFACFDDRDLTRILPSLESAPPKPLLTRQGFHRFGRWVLVFLSGILFTLNGLKVLPLFGSDLGKAKSASASRTPHQPKQLGSSTTEDFWRAVLGARQLADEQLRGYPIVNGYGLFARMTTERHELSVEGSLNGNDWRLYEFRFKPNETSDLAFAGLHMPRLDWQMWFAALYPSCSRRWIFGLLDGLLHNAEPVTALLRKNPFPYEPPKFVRIRKSRARFSTEKENKAQHAYWHFEIQSALYCPILTLEQLRSSKLTRAQ